MPLARSTASTSLACDSSRLECMVTWPHAASTSAARVTRQARHQRVVVVGTLISLPPSFTGQDCWRNSCCTPSDVRLATFEVSCDWNRNLCESMVISSIELGVRSPAVLLIVLASSSMLLAFEFRLSNAETIICVPWDCSAWAAPDTASVPEACAGSLTPAARSWDWPKSRTSMAEACGCAAAPAPPVAPVAPVAASMPAAWIASIIVVLLGSVSRSVYWRLPSVSSAWPVAFCEVAALLDMNCIFRLAAVSWTMLEGWSPPLRIEADISVICAAWPSRAEPQARDMASYQLVPEAEETLPRPVLG